MIYGNIFHVRPNGIEIATGQLQPIGIFEGSQLHGFFIPVSQDSITNYPDLLLTPLDPSSWPFVARLQIMLKHEKGTLVSISKWLAQDPHNINIIFAEATRAGRRHACWNLIVRMTPIYNKYYDEVMKFKKEQIKMDKKYYPWPPILLNVYQEIYAYINTKLCEEAKMNRKVFDGLHVLRFPLDNERIQDRAFCGWPIHSLTYFFIHYQHNEAKLDLKYHNGLIVLKSEDYNIWERIPEQKDCIATKDNCHHAIGSINTYDHTIRLLLLPQEFSDQLVRVSIPYARRCDDCEKKSTEGLMSAMAVSLSSEKNMDMDFWRVHNLTTVDTKNVEIGRIEFLGSVSKNMAKQITSGNFKKNLLERIVEDVTKIHQKMGGDKHITISPLEIIVDHLRTAYIFVSFNNHERFFDKLNLWLREVAHQLVIPDDKILIVRNPIGVINEEVREAIKHCDLGIQFCLYGKSEKYNWLDSEYHLLKILDKDCIRFVESDTTGTRDWLSYWRKNLTSYQGEMLNEFSLHHETETKDRIRKELKKLLQKHYSKTSLQ